MSVKVNLLQEAILTKQLSSHSTCLSPHLEQECCFVQAFCSRVPNNFTKWARGFDSMTCTLFGSIPERHEILRGILFLLWARRAKEGL